MSDTSSKNQVDRRNFLKLGLAGLGVAGRRAASDRALAARLP